ncbi:MAG TPA: hypothetical protein ENI29_04885 [bacterium]|nr:hypothetical protein [bacterium]
MFEELPFILGFMMFSVIFSYLLFHYIGSQSKIIKSLAIVGIIFHELCHLFMCIITNTPRESVSLFKKVESEYGAPIKYYGYVKVNDTRITFIQSFLISFAPLYISFWVFFFLLNFLINSQVDILIFILIFYIMVSIVLSAAPSFADLAVIPKTFQNFPEHSLYQIFLLTISVLSTWMIVEGYNIQAFHEIVIYLIIATFYFGFKYGFKLIDRIYYSIQMKYRYKTISNKDTFKRFTRSRYKPKKQRAIR